MSKRVTIREIAKETGLHFTTVSLGLRDSRLLKPETRQKIQEAARKLGYAPDPMLAALSSYRQSNRTPAFQAVIAWINNWPDQEGLLKNPTFRDYYAGACARAKQMGYLVDSFWLHERRMTPTKLRSILLARNIHALLLPPQPGPSMTPNMDYRDFSAVAFGYTLKPSVLNVVTNHHFHSQNLMLTKLLELGYRRIGLCLGADWDEKVENAWIGGWLVAQWKSPGAFEPIPPFREDLFRSNNFAGWVKEHAPDVIVSCNGMDRRIRQLGYRIPEDIGFASLDINRSQEGISGVDENNFLIGQKAVDVLIGMIHRGERGIPEVPIRTLVESVWVLGKTLRKKKETRRASERAPGVRNRGRRLK